LIEKCPIHTISKIVCRYFSLFIIIVNYYCTILLVCDTRFIPIWTHLTPTSSAFFFRFRQILTFAFVTNKLIAFTTGENYHALFDHINQRSVAMCKATCCLFEFSERFVFWADCQKFVPFQFLWTTEIPTILWTTTLNRLARQRTFLWSSGFNQFGHRRIQLVVVHIK
jgi:hypothetical protein